MKIEIIVEKTKTGYSAYAENYPVYTVGTTLNELKANMLEALNIYFKEQGKTITETDLKITLDLKTDCFFALSDSRYVVIQETGSQIPSSKDRDCKSRPEESQIPSSKDRDCKSRPEE